MSDPAEWAVYGLLTGMAILLLLQIVLLWRNRGEVTERLSREIRAQQDGLAHLEAELRQELALNRQEAAQQARGDREEQTQALGRLAQSLSAQVGQLGQLQGGQLEAFAQQLSRLTQSNDQRFEQLRQSVETRLAAIQADNASKLEAMRKTVDEKLHATLEQRLGESFRLVSDRLEQVHKGLGEMQTLAAGVGDLKKVLTNVKTRGAWGEVQLEALLEQVLAAGQFEKNVMTRPGSGERVEFAIRLPGRGEDGESVWLPIDAKFPTEDYERLLDAQQRADAPAAEAAARALEARLRQEARSMADKYLQPPHTTDFGILFLPAEGLYAEALRRPGLLQALQRECRITLAGPVTLLAMLNSLQMGFRTLALQKRSSEVWQVLGAVKTEFGKFGDVLTRIRSQTQTVLNTLEQAQTRSNVMHRALKQVEALPESAAQTLLPPTPPSSRPAAEG